MKAAGGQETLESIQQKFSSVLNMASQPNMTVPIVMGAIGFLGSSRILPGGEPLSALISSQFSGTLLFSLAIAIYVYVPLAIVTYVRLRFRSHLGGVTFFFPAIFVSTAITLFMAQISFRADFEFGFANAVKLFVVTVLVSLTIGQYRKFLAAELIQNMGVLARVERQRRLLIQEDERLRREIADFLHSSIQSKLVVAGTRLKLIQSDASDPVASELTTVIGELESIRSLDVRNASRALSPDIKNAGLMQCLNELASLYTNTMRITFDCSELSDEVQAAYGLALYRICEQGFLNALTHGAAKNCVVKLWVENNWVHLRLENDGARLHGAGRSARGSAVIEAWVSSFNGTWALRNLDGHGNTARGTVHLEAKLKLEANFTNPMDDALAPNLPEKATAGDRSK